MSADRRGFLKAAGLGALALGGGHALRAAFAAGPASQPGSALVGARWGMLVDTTRCKAREGCRACRLACHRSHNVPDLGDPRHEVKWIWTDEYRHVFAEDEHEFAAEGLADRPVTLLCNHCEKPPCVRVCPTKATFRRADGIVMMDWHRCIGCRYCVVACPYGARSFNWRDPRPFVTAATPDFPTRTRGVVEKCNFCEERLARGQRPACVDACPQRALVFGDLAASGSELRRLLRTARTVQRKPGLGTAPKVFYIV